MASIEPYRELFYEMLVQHNIREGIGAIEWAIDSGIPPRTILMDVINSAMDEIARLQTNKEITLSDIYIVSKIADRSIDRVLGLMPDTMIPAGKIVIGTVSGDYHGLGRKIVASFLRAAGFQVHDLGLNVPSVKFVKTAVDLGAPVICASALLLHTAINVLDIRETLQQAGLEKDIKLVVGGAAFNFDKELYRAVGADATAVNALDAVAVVRDLVGAKA